MSPEASPKMPACVPYFAINDVDAAIAFYTKLGYTEDYTMTMPDGKAMHTSLTTPCGRVTVMFSFNPDAKPVSVSGTTLYVSTPEGATVDQIFAAMKSGGAEITEEPTTQFWGDRTFTYRDPFGVQWMVAQKVAEMVAPEGVSMREPATV